MQFLTLSTLLVCAIFINANPAVEREFRRVVDSNQCLKECMTPVQESQLELSIFKRANYTDYLLKIDTICELITNARHCIDRCGIESNPFALISMNSICSETSKQDAKVLEPCLNEVGIQVHSQCVQFCGDYEQLNNQLHAISPTLNPEDKAAVQQFNRQTNGACSILKCSARCSADQFNKQCGRLVNGQMAGDLIRDTVERVLATHLMDLNVFGLMEQVKKTTQPACSYLFTPDVLFNSRKDTMSTVRMNENVDQVVKAQPEGTQSQDDQLKRVENLLQVRVLKKQLQVLSKQLELLDKQEHKMNAANEMPRFMQAPHSEIPHSEIPHLEANDMF